MEPVTSIQGQRDRSLWRSPWFCKEEGAGPKPRKEEGACSGFFKECNFKERALKRVISKEGCNSEGVLEALKLMGAWSPHHLKEGFQGSIIIGHWHCNMHV